MVDELLDSILKCKENEGEYCNYTRDLLYFNLHYEFLVAAAFLCLMRRCRAFPMHFPASKQYSRFGRRSIMT
jgi:hypothetical protein